MKRYLVFAGEQCYPYGGMLDIQTCVDNTEEADSKAKTLLSKDYQWAHIFDCEKFEFVAFYSVDSERINDKFEWVVNKKDTHPYFDKSTLTKLKKDSKLYRQYSVLEDMEYAIKKATGKDISEYTAEEVMDAVYDTLRYSSNEHRDWWIKIEETVNDYIDFYKPDEKEKILSKLRECFAKDL